MARLARAELFGTAEIAVVHVVNRVVGQCHLIGDDLDQRQEFRFNRKQWIEDELKKLSGAMGIDLLGFAILSNHLPFAQTILLWQGAYAKSFSIQVSLDGDHWTDVFTTNQGRGGREVIPFPPTEARWVRMHRTQRGTPFGYSLWQFQVFRPENNPLDPPEIPPAPEPMENPDAASANFRADPRPTRTAHPAGRYVANR